MEALMTEPNKIKFVSSLSFYKYKYSLQKSLLS